MIAKATILLLSSFVPTLAQYSNAVPILSPRPSTTVGSLPTCNVAAQGQMFFVTDALTPVALATVAAGGAVKIGVTCNGSAWIVQ